jgi:hypothetical protein
MFSRESRDHGNQQELRAEDALPALYRLMGDDEKIRYGDLSSVSEAAKEAITKLERPRAL